MAGTVVVDASLAVKWALEEPFTQQARDLLLVWEQAQVMRLVPSLFLSEVNSPLLKLRREALITFAEANRARDDILAAVRAFPDSSQLTRRALAIADSLGLRVANDSLYVALAEARGCELWTADERYFNAARPRFPRVHWVGEVPHPS